jgi:hypothetical protein
MDEYIELWANETNTMLNEIHDYISSALQEAVCDHFLAHRDTELVRNVLYVFLSR